MNNGFFSSFKNPVNQVIFVIVVVVLGVLFFQLVLSLLGIILSLGVVAFIGLFIYFSFIAIKEKIKDPKTTFRSPWLLMIEAVQTWLKEVDLGRFQAKTKETKKNKSALNVCSHCGHVESSDSPFCSICHQKL